MNELLPAGSIQNGYEIIKPLGKGKFSVVYMVRRQSDGVLCAAAASGFSVSSAAAFVSERCSVAK